MRVQIELTGVKEAAALLDARADRLAQPAGPLLQAVADAWATDFQSNFEKQGSPEGPWPELAPMTQGIRKSRGFPADRPILIRTSDLLNSIRLQEQTDDSMSVGTNLRYAGVLHHGGIETYHLDVPGEREIPARPFVVLHEELIEDTLVMIDEYYFGAGADGEGLANA